MQLTPREQQAPVPRTLLARQRAGQSQSASRQTVLRTGQEPRCLVTLGMLLVTELRSYFPVAISYLVLVFQRQVPFQIYLALLYSLQIPACIFKPLFL